MFCRLDREGTELAKCTPSVNCCRDDAAEVRKSEEYIEKEGDEARVEVSRTYTR